MRIRLFDNNLADHGGIADLESDVVPQVGDFLSLNGTGYRVVERLFQIDEVQNSEFTYVGLAVKEETPEDPSLATSLH